MMKAISSILVLFTLTIGLHGEDISINAKPEKPQILIGDQIHFVVSVTVPKTAKVRLSVARDTLTGKVLVLGLPVRDSIILANGNKTITDKYLITCYDSGSYIIHPFFAEISDGGITKSYTSNVSAIDVTVPTKAPSDTSKTIYDIIGPKKAPVTFMEILPWIIVAIVAVLIIWLLLRFLPGTKLGKLINKEKPAEPAHLIAYRELGILRKEELWQKGEIKEYYSRLSDILRWYIDGRFGIQSPELTTDETVRKLQRSGLVKNDILSIVKIILSDSDMVKFAKYVPDEEINKSSIDDATRFVDITRPVETIGESSEESTGSVKKGGKNA
jgi:hypothetical protein